MRNTILILHYVTLFGPFVHHAFFPTSIHMILNNFARTLSSKFNIFSKLLFQLHCVIVFYAFIICQEDGVLVTLRDFFGPRSFNTKLEISGRELQEILLDSKILGSCRKLKTPRPSFYPESFPQTFINYD